jgi:hypothetical protein
MNRPYDVFYATENRYNRQPLLTRPLPEHLFPEVPMNPYKCVSNTKGYLEKAASRLDRPE